MADLSENEILILNALCSQGMTNAAACGVLANIMNESGGIPERIERNKQYDDGTWYYNTLHYDDDGVTRRHAQAYVDGWRDDTYTPAVNSGAYGAHYGRDNRSEFIKDRTGYGLVGWSFGRKEGLYDYAKSTKRSVGNINMQVEFMLKEITENSYYSATKDAIVNAGNTVQDMMNVARIFCINFEAPNDKEARGTERANYAKEHYSDILDQTFSTSSIATAIVEKALSLVGKPYEEGKRGPNSFDNAGFVFYSYNQGGKSLANDGSAADMYKRYEKQSTSENPGTGKADLLFFTDTKSKDGGSYKGISSVAIADGSGGYIIATESGGVVHKSTSVAGSAEIAQYSYALRLLSDSEFSGGGSTGGDNSQEGGIGYEEYAQLSIIDPYSIAYEQNLVNIESIWETEGYHASYLIDMDHGGEFRFYVPEFTEKAGSNWKDVNVMGRSVTIKAYESTESRSVSIELDLYAGVGFYRATGVGEEAGLETVDKLHKDANFLKSLEYPDYAQAIVRPPSTVQLVLTPAFSMLGVVSDVSIEHMKPLDKYNRSMYLKVSFTVTQTAVNPPDYKDIRNGIYTITSTGNVSTAESRSEDGTITSGDTESDTETPTTEGTTPAEVINPGDISVDDIDDQTAREIWNYLANRVSTGRLPVEIKQIVSDTLFSTSQGQDIKTAVVTILNNLRNHEYSSVSNYIQSITLEYRISTSITDDQDISLAAKVSNLLRYGDELSREGALDFCIAIVTNEGNSSVIMGALKSIMDEFNITAEEIYGGIGE